MRKFAVVSMDPITDGATTFTDLPVAPEGRAWDAGAARSRLARLASSDGSGSKDTLDWERYRQGFLWHDASAPEEFGSYKLPFADVIDGTVKAVWKGLRAAVRSLGDTDLTDSDNAQVKSHLRRYHKKLGKPFPEELSVDEATEFAEELQDADDLQECEELRERLMDSHPNGMAGDEDCEALLRNVDAKIDTLKHDGRVSMCDEFDGEFELLDSAEPGQHRIHAVVGQVDTINGNRRRYPKEEVVKAIARTNQLAKQGSVVGFNTHPIADGDDAVDRVSIRWDKFMVMDHDIHAEGVTTTTDAGEQLVKSRRSGVKLPWSKRGYGRPIHYDKDGNVLADEVSVKRALADGTYAFHDVTDYIFDGADIVLRGADQTRTIVFQVDSQALPPAEDEAAGPQDTIMDKQPDVEKTEDEAPKPAPAETTPPTTGPAVDEGALLARLTESLMPSVTKATTDAAEAAFAAQALRDYKAQLLSTVIDADIRKPLERALAGATSAEDAQAVYDEMKPVIDKALRPVSEFNGFGIVTSDTRDRNHREKLVIAGKVMDRPRTAQEAFVRLAESIEDDGREHPGNKGWVWRKTLENYWNAPEFRGYFECMTKPFLDAATSTSAIGTYMGVALPMLRQAFPQLIPWDIAAVWPLKSKKGTIPTITYTKSTGGYSLSDSAHFDSTYANQTEGSTKSQITGSLTTRDVTAIDRALYIDLTTQAIFDMRAEWDIDIEGEMLLQCGNELARETNFAFIEMLLAQASAGTTTFAQVPPSGSQYTGAEWRDRNVPAAIESVCQDIRDNRYRNPDWCIAGSAVYALLKTLKTITILPADQIVRYADGLALVARMEGTIDVYLAAWLSSRSQAVFGYRPAAGQFADAVAAYCPYVPMYISEPDFTASTNTRARSVSQRDAMTVLQPTGCGILTITTGTAAADWTFE